MARDWLKVLVLLLDEVAAIALLLLALWFFRVPIPLPVAVALALLFGVFIFIIHRAVIPSFRARQVTGREGMIGLEGKVVQPLVPKGVVRVEGEYWRARSVDGEIAAGETVEVIGLNKLVLEVRHKRQSSKS